METGGGVVVPRFEELLGNARNTLRRGAGSHLPDAVVRFAEKIVPFVGAVCLGAILGYFLMRSLGMYLTDLNFALRATGIPDGRSARQSLAAENAPTLKDFVDANPFGATLRKVEPAAEKKSDAKAEDTSKAVAAAGLKDISLSGTFPGIAALFSEKGKERIVIRGDSLNGYSLVEVTPYDVVLSGDREIVVLSLYYGPTQPPVRKTPEKQETAKPTPQAQEKQPDGNEVKAATATEAGIIDRDLVNRMLMNPFDEMKRFRLRPKFEGAQASGIEVQWLDKESILTKLGVEQGDVLQSVNGIPIRNMGDVANAINSLMGGSRFDVQVVRNGKEMPLTYTVR
jgi:type II secretory pathway component PulC